MGKGYTTGKKESFRRLNEAGEPITVWRIWAFSDGGTRFSVDLPDEKLDEAEARLEAKARRLDKI